MLLDLEKKKSTGGGSSETRLNQRTAWSCNCQKGERLPLWKGHTWPRSNTWDLICSHTEPACRYSVYPAITASHDLCKSARNELLGKPEKSLELFHRKVGHLSLDTYYRSDKHIKQWIWYEASVKWGTQTGRRKLTYRGHHHTWHIKAQTLRSWFITTTSKRWI